MIIFTQKDKNGWVLSKDDEFTIDFSLYQKLRLEIGYILNGTYHKITSGTGPDFSNTISVSEDGTYYFCVTNRSSSNAIIESGEITEDRKCRMSNS